MSESTCSLVSLGITRHCMQQLLHSAMATGEQGQPLPHFGLLSGNTKADTPTLTNMMVVPASALNGSTTANEKRYGDIQAFAKKSDGLFGFFITSRMDTPSLPALHDSVSRWLAGQALPDIQIYAVLEMNHKGRLEIHCFENTSTRCEIPVSMQEDGTLYPQSLTH